MSKKNNKATKRKAHEFDIQREKQEAEQRAKKLEKKQKNGVQKKTGKGVRIRKGVVLKGIKVVDSESKKKVKKIIAKMAATKHMEVDGGQPAAKKQKKAKTAAGGKGGDAMDTQ